MTHPQRVSLGSDILLASARLQGQRVGIVCNHASVDGSFRHVVDRLTAAPGVFFRPAVFEPTFQKHARTTCGGCQIHVLLREAFRPVAVGVALIAQFRHVSPATFAWRTPPYEYEHEKEPFDILAGSAVLRTQIEQGVPVAEISASWQADEQAFARLRQPFLLY